MATLMEKVERSQLRENPLPDFRVGCTVRVNYRITEGNKERIQAYEGVVIGMHCGVNNNKATFTVRKIAQGGHGVERIFPRHAPRIESRGVLKDGRVRQAKLYYLRERHGKAARIKERLNSRLAKSSA